jgi:hypothetical protein
MSAEPPQHIRRPVSRVLYGEGSRPHVTAIPLRRRLPGAFSNLPGRPDPDMDPGDCSACAGQPPHRPYSVLLPVGFAVPPTLPPARCALTAPFHPYLPLLSLGRAVCSLWHFPWAHARRTLSGTVCPWSPDFPPAPTFRHWHGRPSGRLTIVEVGTSTLAVNISHAGRIGLTRASRAASSVLSVAMVEASMKPSTRAGRKCRWKAATASRVVLSR